MQMAIRVGFIGASGFTGAELMRFIHIPHPEFELGLATGDTMAGSRAVDLYPASTGYLSLRHSAFQAGRRHRARPGVPRASPYDGLDGPAPQLVGIGGMRGRPAAAYRLKDAAHYSNTLNE